MRSERVDDVRTAYETQFIPNKDDKWFESYVRAVRDIKNASEAEFRAPEFQRRLWELEGVASVGMGSSVVVTGAYEDAEVADALWRLREWIPPDDVLDRARAFDAEFARIMGIVFPRHNARRPFARLIRIFAAVRSSDCLCLLDWNRTRLFREWLEKPNHKLDLVGQHVVCRDALKDVLLLEPGPDSDVLQSQFAWYAWDHILRPVEPAAETAEAAPTEGDALATATPRLAVLPAKIQRKGLLYLAKNLELTLAVVRAAENGIDRASLDQQAAEEAPALSRGSRSNLLAQTSYLGLLSYENGSYRPTPSGRALLDGEPPADVFAPIMVRGVFGFAQILDDIGREGVMTRIAIAKACRSYYPRWTTDFAPNQLVAWMKDLGLVEIDGVGTQAAIKLTEPGEYWRSGLPGDMKRSTFLLTEERPDEKSTSDEQVPSAAMPLVGELKPASYDDVMTRFRDDDYLRTLVFEKNQIALIHAALHSASGKRFVLLAGLSGTGKTSMAASYAQAYCEALGLSPSTHYEQVAVLPDWTDPTGLLGFVNPLSEPPAFQETEALQLVLAASANPDKPYFLCLDEMNLARVEYYFAPFLSAMEGRNGLLAVHAGRDPVDGIPPRVAWPTNLFIFGTVNMDETTHPFSDKVLDRAFTFEFWDIDLEGWQRSARQRGASNEALQAVLPVLAAMCDALKPARRHFGYRTCDEVLGFVTGWKGADSAVAIDAAILAKVLPKVRGDDGGALPTALVAARKVCSDYKLSRSGEKLRQMQDTLGRLGAVRFWS